MCTRFDSEVNSQTSTQKLVTTLKKRKLLLDIGIGLEEIRRRLSQVPPPIPYHITVIQKKAS